MVKKKFKQITKMFHPPNYNHIIEKLPKILIKRAYQIIVDEIVNEFNFVSLSLSSTYIDYF